MKLWWVLAANCFILASVHKDEFPAIVNDGEEEHAQRGPLEPIQIEQLEEEPIQDEFSSFSSTNSFHTVTGSSSDDNVGSQNLVEGDMGTGDDSEEFVSAQEDNVKQDHGAGEDDNGPDSWSTEDGQVPNNLPAEDDNGQHNVPAEDGNGQYNVQAEDGQGLDDGTSEDDDEDGGIPVLIPVVHSSEVMLNNLLDSSCDITQLVQLLNVSLQRGDLMAFETACVSCLQQYDPDNEHILDVLELTFVLDRPAFFEALITGQCKSKFAEKILTYLPSMKETFITPALRQCAAVIPRHAVEVWRGEFEPENREVAAVDWTGVEGITIDLHTQLQWPYKNDEEHQQRRVAGLWARYSATGEGAIGLLDQFGEQLPFYATNMSSDVVVIGASNGPLADLDSVMNATGDLEFYKALNSELFTNSNRFRAAFGRVTPEGTEGLSLYVTRLTDGGPMLLVYRAGNLVYPTNLFSYTNDQKELSLDAQVWAQPQTRSFLPIPVEATVSLEAGDVVVLVPDTLQQLAPEINLRGLMYSVDVESLPEIVADFLKSVYGKSKQPVEMAAAIVI